MLSTRSRLLVRILGSMFAIMGAVLFVAPTWSTENFHWKITPFVAMTMGGWYLGSAVYAWEATRTWRWSSNQACLIFLWIFSLLEAALLVIHRDVLRLDALFAVPYILTLVVGTITAVVGIIDWLRVRPEWGPEGIPVPILIRLTVVTFVVLVAYLAAPLLAGIARGGTIWPGELTLLTARAFGAFYLALSLSAVPLLWARGLAPILAFMRAGMGLIVPITIAGLVYLHEFDFTAKPAGRIYLGAYFAAGIGALLILAYGWLRRMQRTAATAAGGSQ